MFTQLTVGTENSSFSLSADSTVVIINLGPDDLNSLKVQPGLATSINNTYLYFPNDTIQDMKAFRLKRIIPAHCTGWRAVHALIDTFGMDALVPSAVGRQFSF